MSETSFLPRGLDHETMHEAADESAVKLSLLSGVGAGLGGPASSSNAIFVSTANRTPVCVVEAERRAAFELARKQAELRAAGSEPEYDHELVSVVQEIYISATKKYTLSIGKSVSKRERVETKLDDASFIYSEAEFEVMAVMLQKVKLRYGRPDVGFSGASGIMQSGGRFFDLGSGTGKPCIAALCLHSWAYVCGIEMLEGLYNTNLEMVATFESKFGRALPEKVDALSVKQLKEQLVLRGVKFADCREKCELVDRLKQALLEDEIEGVDVSKYTSPQTTPVASPSNAAAAAAAPPPV